MQSLSNGHKFSSQLNFRHLNGQKCQSKHKLLNGIDLAKSQVLKSNEQGSSLKKKLDFNNFTVGFKDIAAQYIFPNNQKLAICEKQNKNRTIKNTDYLREKFITQKIQSDNSANDFKRSTNYLEINWSDKESIFMDLEVRKRHSPTFTSITKFNQNVQEKTVKPYFQMNSHKNSFRLLTGSVENILFWSKLKKGLQILFEVTAILEDTQEGKWKWEKILILSDSKMGSKLLAHYFEIDRKLPKLQGKSTITCVGKFISGNHLQAYKVKLSSENEKNDCQRLGFICNRTAEEMILCNETGSKTQL